MTRAAVLGAGSWGTAFAKVLADAGCDVTLWPAGPSWPGRSPSDGENRDYLPGIRLPAGASRATADAGARRWTAPTSWCSPCRRRRCGTTSPLGAAAARRTPRWCRLMKGIELGTTKRMSEVIARGRPAPAPTGSPSSPGPTWPARSPRSSRPRPSSPAPTPTGRALQAACHTPYFRPYTNDDVVGCELGGAVKNVIALACGIAEGAGLRRQHQGLADHPRAGRDRPAGRGARRRPDHLRRAGRARRPGRHLHLAAVAQPHLRRAARPRRDAGAGAGSAPGRPPRASRAACRSGTWPARTASRCRSPSRSSGSATRAWTPARDVKVIMTARGEAGVSRAVSWGDGTRAVHAGRRGPPPVPGAPLLPGPVFAAPFHLGDQPPRAGGRRRLRAGPSTRRCAAGGRDRRAGGRPVPGLRHRAWPRSPRRCSPCVRPGDTRGAAVRRLLHDPAAGRRRARRASASRVEYVPTAGDGRSPPRRLDGVRLVLLETPGNPRLDVCDIAAVAARGARGRRAGRGRQHHRDAARPAPAGARRRPPVGSDTKALTGHSDLLLGYVSTTDDELLARLERLARPHRQHAGPVRRLARRTGRWAPWTCGWPGRRPTRPRSPSCWRRARRSAACAGRGCRTTRRTRSPRGRCCGPGRGLGRARRRGGRRARFLRRTRLWSAATTFGGRAQHGRPPGAVGRRRRPPGSSGSPAGSRTPPTWSPT